MFTDSKTTSTELSLIIAMILSVIFFTTIFFIIGCISVKCGKSTDNQLKHQNLIHSQVKLNMLRIYQQLSTIPYLY